MISPHVSAQKIHEPSQIDSSPADQEIKYRRVSELTGTDLLGSPKTPLAGYDSADYKSILPISELTLDRSPVELYSPLLESANNVDGGRDYFKPAKPHRRGVQRDRELTGHHENDTSGAKIDPQYIEITTNTQSLHADRTYVPLRLQTIRQIRKRTKSTAARGIMRWSGRLQQVLKKAYLPKTTSIPCQ